MGILLRQICRLCKTGRAYRYFSLCGQCFKVRRNIVFHLYFLLRLFGAGALIINCISRSFNLINRTNLALIEFSGLFKLCFNIHIFIFTNNGWASSFLHNQPQNPRLRIPILNNQLICINTKGFALYLPVLEPCRFERKFSKIWL